MCRRNALTHISEIVEESDFSDTASNSTYMYVNDVQGFIPGNNFSAQIFRHKIEKLDEICIILKKGVSKILRFSAFVYARQYTDYMYADSQ